MGALLQIADHASGQTYFPAYDGNGNVTVLVNSTTTERTVADVKTTYLAGAVAAAFEYSPFGEFLRTYTPDPTAADQPFRFSTKYADYETGLVYYGRRYYNPFQGRFFGRDPIEEDGGLNLYAFCGNDGVNYWDYLGQEIIIDPSTNQAWVDRFYADLQGLAGAGAVGQMLYNFAMSPGYRLNVNFIPGANAAGSGLNLGSTQGTIILNPDDPAWIGTTSQTDPNHPFDQMGTALGLTEFSQRSVLTALNQAPPSGIVTIGHEIGHAMGLDDSAAGSGGGPGPVGNVTLIENAIRNALGFGNRTAYYDSTNIGATREGAQMFFNAMARYGPSYFQINNGAPVLSSYTNLSDVIADISSAYTASGHTVAININTSHPGTLNGLATMAVNQFLQVWQFSPDARMSNSQWRYEVALRDALLRAAVAQARGEGDGTMSGHDWLTLYAMQQQMAAMAEMQKVKSRNKL